MKRYLLFAGKRYSFSCGGGDYQGSFDSIEECEFSFQREGKMFEWAHILDSKNEEWAFTSLYTTGEWGKIKF